MALPVQIIHLDINENSFELSESIKDLDISEYELKIYFEKTSKQEEKNIALQIISSGCTLNIDPITKKIRILTIPSTLLAVHLFNTTEIVNGKRPLQFQYSYIKEIDLLWVRFVSDESIGKDTVKTHEALVNELLIESTVSGIIGFEIISVKYLIEIK